MDYLFILAFQLLGMWFHVAQRIMQIKPKYPDHHWNGIIIVFWKEDWNTMAISGGVVSLQLLIHLALAFYKPQWISGENFMIYSLGVALILGYAGQRIIYKYLGTAEIALAKKGEQIIGNV